MAARPILGEPRHPFIVSLTGLGEDEKSFKDDTAHLLLDEARVLDASARPTPAASPTASRASSDSRCARRGNQQILRARPR
jgi:hypothetical protein